MKKSEPVVTSKETRPEIGLWSSFSARCFFKDLAKEWLKNSKKTKTTD